MPNLKLKTLFVFLALGLFALPLIAWGATAPGATTTARAAGTVINSPMPSPTNLSPIVVYGEHVPLPVAMQILKDALARPWSGDPKDGHKLVCRTEPQIGSHLYTLLCQTNLQHARESKQTQLSLSSAISASIGGVWANPVRVETVNWLNRQTVNPAALHAMLAKLPPAGSSYTLQITDHGKVVSKWVFKSGKLVKVWHRSKGASK